MKEKLILIILLLISSTSFGKKIYTMTKEDFANQFNENHFLERIYCQNENGQKVWLHCNNNTILTISFDDNKNEDLMLQSIKFKQSRIEAIKYNVWMPSKKISTFDFKEVNAIYIVRKYQEFERPFFDIDSIRNIAKQKNDSLRNIYNNGSENVIYVIKRNSDQSDTIRILENACYNLTFDDNNETEFGVVQKIVNDSIYISNYFNTRMASKKKKKYEQLGYRIKSIKKISLLKSGGYAFNYIEIDSNSLHIENVKRNVNRIPYWFAINPYLGEVNFYRLWQTDKGYPGITEKDGNAIWYEGERTE
jgi:hypothetical protein